MPLDTPAQAARVDTDPITDLETELSALRRPMTVILGRAQLLRRRIRTGQTRSTDDCMETLASIEEAVLATEARLRALEG